MKNTYKQIHLILPFIFLLLLLSGCVEWETEEVKIGLNKDGSGNIEVIFGPLFSDREKTEEREEDFAYLLYDGIENDTAGSPHIKKVKGRLEEKDGNLFGYISGNFDNLNALKEFNILQSDDRLIYKPEIGANILRTNGTISKDASGNITISWNADTDKIKYKIRKVEYPAETSLLPEYKKYLKDKDYFKNLYLRLKLKNAAALIPLPQIDLHLGMTLNINSLDENNFIDIDEEIKKLLTKANSSDKDEKIYSFCRLGRLLNSTGKTKDSVKYGEDALKTYEEIKEREKLSPETLLCMGKLFRMRGERVRALETFRDIAMDYPQFWPAYTEIYTEYMYDPRPKEEELSDWINRGDSNLRNYLNEASDISAQNAFEIFRYSIARNIAADTLNNNQGGNPVEPLSYQMLTLSVDKEPENIVYRGMLGYTQLWLITLKFFEYLGASAGEPRDAITQAIDSLNKDKETADLLKKAEENLNYVYDRSDNKQAAIFQNMAYLYFLKRGFEKAEELYIKAIEVAPSQGEAYYSLTAFYKTIYSKEGFIDRAKAEKMIELLERKLKLNPSGKDRFIAGKLTLEKGDIEGAYNMFRQSLDEDDRYYPSIVGYLKTWLMMSPEEAGNIVKEADRLLERDYGDEHVGKTELHFAKGVALGLSGKRQEGVEELKTLFTHEDAGIVSAAREAVDIFSK